MGKRIEEQNEELLLRLKIKEIDGRVKEMEIMLQHKQNSKELQKEMDALKAQSDALNDEYLALQQQHQRDRRARAEEEDEKMERQFVLEQQLKTEQDAHAVTMHEYVKLGDAMDSVHDD